MEISTAGTSFEVVDGKSQGVHSLRIPAVGSVYVENALAAFAALLELGINADAIAQSFASLPPPPGRFEILHESPLVVVDFAHTPAALECALHDARVLTPPRGRLHCVFGAGGGRDKGKRHSMGRDVGQLADRVTITNDNPRFEDPEDIARDLSAGIHEGGRPHLCTTLDRVAAIREAVLNRSTERPSDHLRQGARRNARATGANRTLLRQGGRHEGAFSH